MFHELVNIITVRAILKDGMNEFLRSIDKKVDVDQMEERCMGCDWSVRWCG